MRANWSDPTDENITALGAITESVSNMDMESSTSTFSFSFPELLNSLCLFVIVIQIF